MTEQEKQVWYDALKERANQPGTYAVTGGMRVAELGDGWARGELLLEERHRNPMGIVHGGVYCTMMDQVAGSAACTRGSMCRTVNCEVRFLAAAQGAAERVWHAQPNYVNECGRAGESAGPLFMLTGPILRRYVGTAGKSEYGNSACRGSRNVDTHKSGWRIKAG